MRIQALTRLAICTLLAVLACREPARVEPPVEIENRPTAALPPGEVQTAIRRIEVEDLGCYGECPRFAVAVMRSGDVSRTDLGTNLRPASSPSTSGLLAREKTDFLFRWFHAELPRLAKISANEANCDIGCYRLTVERDGAATFVWVFTRDNRYLPLWGAAELVVASLAGADLRPCG